MIQFTVIGTPVSQGSMTPFCLTAENADIESAIAELRQAASIAAHDDDLFGSSREPRLRELVSRLEAVGKWPIWKPTAKGGYFAASMRASNATKLNKWRKAVAAAARAAYHGELMTGAVSVRVTFWFRRPLSHFRTGKFSHLLKDTAPERHTSFPDADKLLRAVLDSLTGIIYTDDKQVDDARAWKRWLPNREDPECAVIDVF